MPISVILGIAVVALIAIGVWWVVPKWQTTKLDIPDPKLRADVEDNFRKTIGQLLGGAAVVIGAGLAFDQTQQTIRSSEKQSAAALTSSQAQSASAIEVTRNLQFSQQVAAGFASIAATGDSTSARMNHLGGIYALEGVMNASDKYYKPILEALSSFVRENTNVTSLIPPNTDVQAALTVIGRRVSGVGIVDLSGAHIKKANLVGADLRGANLANADLSGSNLSGAKLNGANLSGAILVGADLQGGVDLRGAILTNGANLSGANLSGADLSRPDSKDEYSKGADTNLTGAILNPMPGGSPPNLTSVPVGTPTNLTSAKLKHAILNGASLTNANASGAADFSDAKLDGAKLVGIDLSNAILTDASLTTKADLSGAHLDYAHLERAKLNTAILVGAQLPGAHLQGAVLSGASLALGPPPGTLKVNMTNADLTDVTVTPETDLSGALFSNTNVSGVALAKTNATRVQLVGACGTPSTTPRDVTAKFETCLTPAQSSPAQIPH